MGERAIVPRVVVGVKHTGLHAGDLLELALLLVVVANDWGDRAALHGRLADGSGIGSVVPYKLLTATW